MKKFLKALKQWFFFIIWILKVRPDPPDPLYKRRRIYKIAKNLVVKLLLKPKLLMVNRVS